MSADRRVPSPRTVLPAESVDELFDEAPVGYLTVWPDRTVARVNRTLLRWTGWPLDHLLGRDWGQALLTRAGRTLLETHVAPLLELRGEAREIALDLDCADGRRLAALLYFSRRGGEGPAPLHDRIAVVEATDRRNHERRLLQAKHDAEEANESLRVLAAELERRIEERTRSLQAAYEELDSFSSAVSHDLRAPLRAMLGFARMLRERHGATLDPAAARLVDQLDESALRMSGLIDGLLALSHGARVDLNLVPVDLGELATAILAQLAESEPGRRVRWTAEPGLEALADRVLIENVLRNLLGNAWKFTSARQDASIRVYAREIDGRRYFCVSDDGVGFDANDAQRMFEPFVRLHADARFGGSGIGLATVQRIVRRHGGEVVAEPTPGGGATFRFWLPARES